MIERVILPDSLRREIEEAARATFPRECCGLLEGVSEGGTVHVAAIHPTRNLADGNDRFEIDPADQIRVMKELRGTAHDSVGCYHSHPNGRAEPSARDIDGAFGEGFVWVIVALEENGNETSCPPPPRGEVGAPCSPTNGSTTREPGGGRRHIPNASRAARSSPHPKSRSAISASPRGGDGRNGYDATLRAFELGSGSFREIAIVAAP
jgi:proteasome lid subunit RPN8/RPN11